MWSMKNFFIFILFVNTLYAKDDDKLDSILQSINTRAHTPGIWYFLLPKTTFGLSVQDNYSKNDAVFFINLLWQPKNISIQKQEQIKNIVISHELLTHGKVIRY